MLRDPSAPLRTAARRNPEGSEGKPTDEGLQTRRWRLPACLHSGGYREGVC